MIVGLTSGCWDLLHIGHLRYLARCRALCDLLVVGVDCDLMVKAAKGDKRPIICEDERLQLVAAQTPVGRAVMLRTISDLHHLSVAWQVDKVFKHEGFATVPREEIVGVHGTKAELVIVPDEPGLVSTSAIIERVMCRYGVTR